MRISFENTFSGLVLLLVFSLAFVYPFVPVANQRIPFTDFVFLPVLAVFTFGLVFKKFAFRFHVFFYLLAFYLFALFVSAIFSSDPRASLIKFSGEIYLAFLCVITFNFIDDLDDAKKLVLAWLAGTMFVLMVCLVTVGLFYLDRENALLRIFLNHYGTVPVGNYPRIKATFFHSNMLCNYLSVSLLLAALAGKAGWINSFFAKILIGLILLASFFTFSPGLGGIALSLGIIIWLFYKKKNRTLAKTGLISGGLISAVFLALLVFAMQPHPTAPFVLRMPLIEKEVYPSSRVMVWSAAFETFKNNFPTGVGLGEEVCRVRYLNPTGILEDLRDGHNTILNVSAQAGILGFISIFGIIFYFLKKSLSFKKISSESGVFYNCCAAAVLSAFIYQGVSGSFEETRHLWVLFGLFLAADRLSIKET